MKNIFRWAATKAIALHLIICLLGAAWGALVAQYLLASLFLILLVLGSFLWFEWRYSDNDNLLRTEHS